MDLTDETQAVMLLTVSLGKSVPGTSKPLTPTESGDFAQWLKDRGSVPGDLLKPNAADLLVNPEAGFHPGNAMARNKYIYCLAHHAIVVSSTPNKGGTWEGAVENQKHQWVPLLVKRTEPAGSGNPKLYERGGRWLEGLEDPVLGARHQDASPAQGLGAGYDSLC